jgi:hypothetical protein
MAQSLLKCGGHLIGFSRPDAYVPFIKSLLTKKQGRLLMDDKIYSFIKKSSKTQKLLSKLKKVVTYPNPQGGKLRENPFSLGRKLARKLLPQIKDSNFDYLVTFSDGIAQGVAQYLDEQNIAIPDDLQILGFDKIDSIEFLKFPTSTIEVPVNEMIDKLISLMETPSTDKFDHICMTKLHLL